MLESVKNPSSSWFVYIFVICCVFQSAFTKFFVKSISQIFFFKLLLIPRWPYHNQSVWMGLGFLCGEPFGFCWHILLKFCLLEWHINWYSGVEFFCGHFVYDILGVFYLEMKKNCSSFWEYDWISPNIVYLVSSIFLEFDPLQAGSP